MGQIYPSLPLKLPNTMGKCVKVNILSPLISFASQEMHWGKLGETENGKMDIKYFAHHIYPPSKHHEVNLILLQQKLNKDYCVW